MDWFLLLHFTDQHMKCHKALGVAYKDGRVLDRQINASSWLNENFTPQHGRLLNPTSAWCAQKSDARPSIRVMFDGPTVVLGMVFQSDPSADNFVKQVQLLVQKEQGKDFQNVGNKYVVSSPWVFWRQVYTSNFCCNSIFIYTLLLLHFVIINGPRFIRFQRFTSFPASKIWHPRLIPTHHGGNCLYKPVVSYI